MSGKLVKIHMDSSLEIPYQDSKILKKSLKEISCKKDYLKEIKFIIPCGDDLTRLKLLVTLSPIFIACFDSSKSELEYFIEKIEESNFSYGLYPNFFSFDENVYRKFYAENEIKEDIYLTEDKNIIFSINPLDDKYITALAYLIEKLIIDDCNKEKLVDYFAKIRDDIVINGRRSILANGIQAFYLSKYVVVWMLILCEGLMETYEDARFFLNPIYEKTNKLKRVGD